MLDHTASQGSSEMDFVDLLIYGSTFALVLGVALCASN
jgi:hypothetical protein